MTKKESLLEAAKELFGEHGYNDTTFKKISEKAGVALGLLTHHYGNKEKLFMAAGLDVLERLVARLKAAVADSGTGLEAVLRFCEEYLVFSIDPDENFLVLIRCSPYSDVKTREDREVMEEKFAEVYEILEDCVRKGIKDGTVIKYPSKELATNVQCNLVGSVRTRLMSPYSPPSLYDDMLQFITRSLDAKRGC